MTTLYVTPDTWGDEVIATTVAMKQNIASLRKLGNGWEACNIDECEQYDIVRRRGNLVIGERLYCRHDEFNVYRHTGSGFYEFVSQHWSLDDAVKAL